MRVVEAVRWRAEKLISKPTAAPPIHDMEPEFHTVYERCAPFTMTPVERMYALWQAVRYVSGRVDGDYVECGVWRGGSSMLAGHTFHQLGERRNLWLYDTFEGMPDPGDRDRRVGGDPLDWETARTNDYIAANASLEEVKRNMGELDARYVVGKVEDTIPAQAPDRIALLRLDTDWYESTRHELEHLWPRLVPGGVLILDDYGHWEGHRQAVDEYFADNPPLLNRIDYSGRMAIKATP